MKYSPTVFCTCVCSLFLLISTVATAQNNVLTNAILYRTDGNIMKAKEEIDKACLNDKTSKLPKTWYYRGLIYKDIYQSPTSSVQALDPDALKSSYEAFLKVLALEVPPGEYATKSSDLLSEIWTIYINAGVKQYEEGNYIKALNQFEHAQEVKPSDTTAFVYALYAAEELNNDDLAMRYCDRLTKIGYKSPYVYYRMIDIEFNLNKNPEKAFAISRKALQEYPNDKDLLNQQTDMLIRMNRSQEALTNLNKLLEQKPNDVEILLNIASQYDRLKDKDNARKYYTKVLSIDSLNYIANYNMAVNTIKQAKEIEKKIVRNDSVQLLSNKGYKVTDYTRDPLRVELKNTLIKSQSFYNKAIGHSRDALERKNLEIVSGEIKRLKLAYLPGLK